MNPSTGIGRGSALLLSFLFTSQYTPLAQGATLGTADARTSTTAYVSYRPAPGQSEISDYGYDSPPRVEEDADIGAASGSSSSVAFANPLTTTASNATGSAGAGLAGVSAGVAVNTAGGIQNSGSGTAEAVVSWWDGVVIDKPGLTGQTGYLHASLVLDGNLFVQAGDQTASNLERAFATLSILGAGLTPASGQAAAGDCLSGAGYCAYAFAGTSNISGAPANGYYAFGALSSVIPFVFGTEFYIDYTMKAKASAQAISWDEFAVAGAATGQAEFAHTLAWGGIDGIFLGNGTQIEDFALNSGSGFDYRQSAASPVPVPAAAWLFGSALLGLLGMARRRT